MSIIMEKYHGTGNDYFICDPNKNEVNLTEKSIRRICNRHFGFGSDGILYGPIIEDGEYRVRIFNPDGSEAEKSGNGVRIFAKYLKDAGYVKEDGCTMKTIGGEVAATYLDKRGEHITLQMGKASFLSTQIPVDGEEREVLDEEMYFGGKKYVASCVSVGNPHCVIVFQDISKDRIEKLGPLVENSPYFPKRINVQLLKVLDPSNLQIEIYERGAGYTLASGTSACAVAAVANRLGLCDKTVMVHMQGGSVSVEIGDDGVLSLTGEVKHIGTIMLAKEYAEALY